MRYGSSKAQEKTEDEAKQMQQEEHTPLDTALTSTRLTRKAKQGTEEIVCKQHRVIAYTTDNKRHKELKRDTVKVRKYEYNRFIEHKKIMTISRKGYKQ